MKLIHWRWLDRSYRFVIEETTESDNGRLSSHIIEHHDTETEARKRVAELRQQRDGLYPTDIADLSQNGSQSHYP